MKNYSISLVMTLHLTLSFGKCYMIIMNYPSIKEYIEAIRFAEDNFEQLKHLRSVLGEDGEPVMTSGNFAVVFKMKDEQTGKLHAVKCFLREQEGRAEAYRQIAEELEYVSSTFLTPIKYLDKELFVETNASDDTEFPVLLMDWVEGLTIEQVIAMNPSSDEIYNLAYSFSKFALWMVSQPFAHGDLKPDNILIREDGTIAIVDYDGMYVPAMKGQLARECGSPDYRHPQRTIRDFDEHIDDFSLIILELSLLIIAQDANLLAYKSGRDRLLFSKDDFLDFHNKEIYRLTLKHKTNPLISPLYDLFEKVLLRKNVSKDELQSLSIPPIMQLPLESLYEQESIDFLSETLWRLSRTDYVRSVNLNDKSLELFSQSSMNDIFFRACVGDDSHSLDIVVSDGKKKGYALLGIDAFRKILVSLNMWDEGIKNKIKLLQTL